jgi:hypothetical protein
MAERRGIKSFDDVPYGFAGAMSVLRISSSSRLKLLPLMKVVSQERPALKSCRRGRYGAGPANNSMTRAA